MGSPTAPADLPPGEGPGGQFSRSPADTASSPSGHEPSDHEPSGHASRAAVTAEGALDKSNQRVREMFAQIAPRYDLMNHLLSLNIDRAWRRKTVARLRIRGTTPILDTCTGTGDLALAIAHAVGDAVPVVGSDFCHPMLARGIDKTRRGAPRNVFFVEADSQRLPFPDDAFQCVTVAFGLRNIADTDRGLAEMRRVCQPGGQIAVLEFSQPTAPILKQLYGFYFKHVLPRIGQRMARNDNSAYEYLPASVSSFPSGRALADRMEANGIGNVRMHPMTCGVATLYEGTK